MTATENRHPVEFLKFFSFPYWTNEELEIEKKHILDQTEGAPRESALAFVVAISRELGMRRRRRLEDWANGQENPPTASIVKMVTKDFWKLP